MNKEIAKVSKFFAAKQPSAIRQAQILFAKRIAKEKETSQPLTRAVNVAIGNVSLPTYPKMIAKYSKPDDEQLKRGIWKYSATVGTEKCRKAFKNIIRSFLPEKTKPKLSVLIGNGSSDLMKLAMLGVCGAPGTQERPLLVIDPVYTNYKSIANEMRLPLVAVSRTLQKSGKFTDIPVEVVKKAIKEYQPGGLLIIPYDNPSGQLMRQTLINEYAKLCLENKMFLISDEAYRGLYYTADSAPTIWKITNADVPGIEDAGIRISLETMSKVFNACGLRMGALVTDNKYFHEQAVAANTTYLCPSIIGQNLVEVFADESKQDIQNWISELRDYYQRILENLTKDFNKLLPGIIISLPEASIYSIIDVRNIAKPNFNAEDFVKYCATKGAVEINGRQTTLLVSPMAEFYNPKPGEQNPGTTQMRIACVVSEEEMKIVPKLFAELFRQYEARSD